MLKYSLVFFIVGSFLAGCKTKERIAILENDLKAVEFQLIETNKIYTNSLLELETKDNQLITFQNEVSELRFKNEKLIDEIESIKSNIIPEGPISIDDIIERVFPKNKITNTSSFDESKIVVENFSCDFEQLIRDNYNLYQIKHVDQNVIWFYNFIRTLETNFFSGDSYLLEVFIIDLTNENEIFCEVKYFESLEKRIDKIKSTVESGEGISKLRNLIKNCDG